MKPTPNIEAQRSTSVGAEPSPAARGLLPGGTARALFLRRRAQAQVEGDHAMRAPVGSVAGAEAALPDAFWARLRDAEVSERFIWSAWEIARCAPAASPADRRALALLTIALLTAMDAGSSYLLLSPGAVAALLPALSGGDVGSPDTLAQMLGEAIVAGDTPTALQHLFGPPESTARTAFVVANGGIYAHRLWALERRVLERLAGRIDAPSALAPSATAVEQVLESLARNPEAHALTDEQTAAIRMALERRLTIVTGGPGTGKTSTIVGLLRALFRLGVRAEDIALAAPTGRSAQRVTESVRGALAPFRLGETRRHSARPAGHGSAAAEIFGDARDEPSDARLADELVEATTLHRLLGFRGDRVNSLDVDVPTFYHLWPLPQRIVIVDEASMIDLPLMDALLAALSDETALLLLGDADQLPSVELGAVFRDLTASVPRIVARLTRSHRLDERDPAAAEILAVASSINRGGPPQGAPALDRSAPPRTASSLSWQGFETLPATALPAFLARWRSDILRGDVALAGALDRRFALRHRRLTDEGGQLASGSAAEIHGFIDLHGRSRVLTLTRVSGGACSAAAVNRMLHGLFQQASADRNRDRGTASAAFLPGEPVLVQRNDYGRGLYNGDLGVVIRATCDDDRRDHLQVAFPRPQSPDGLMFYPLDELLEQVTLAFASTVHKAQGSEYDHVALVLPPHDIPLLSREILYTALTRARRSVVVIGDLALLARGAARALVRASGLPYPSRRA